MSTWKRRKERLQTDPEFRARVYAQQAESRRRRRLREEAAKSQSAPEPKDPKVLTGE